MTPESIQFLVAMVVYMAAVIVIGIVYAKRANKSSESYFLGGRSLGPWVTAMSAEASDMSGWLLMGLPGVAYWCGLADAAWTAIGLAVGTYFNWLIVSKRLRRYSIRANNSITLPEFFSNRFREKNKLILTIAAAFILIFFTVYAASCLVTCGKLFSTLFGLPYIPMMIIGAVFVLVYTILGGFLAESASDFMQSIVMIVALGVVVTLGVASAGGLGAVFENAGKIDGFLDFFGLANPVVDESGTQLVIAGVPQFGEAKPYGILSICSMLAWGLGYFGMPQVLLRFMAIRREDELKRSRRIAMVWVVVSLAVAVFIGIVGRQLFPTVHLTASASENIFITMATSSLPPIVAGLVMAGILAATISSSDSYLLIAASAFAKNIFHGLVKKNATDKQVMLITRITLIAITAIAMIIALDENSVIFSIVSFAWAGFGATFGPLMLFSLFWKRTTQAGAIAGMVGGAGMVFLWKLVISTLGGAFAIYELLPAFIFSSICIVVVSLLTPAPSREVEEDFEAVKAGE
ncbi:MAG: sodium/proline symporter [Ruminococcaceae bacterium]|nr:sodium/proline symporter [Oscillospiraceae bacterium]